VPDGKCVWRHQTEYFNAQTYLAFIDEDLLPQYYRRTHRVYLIQDNASYHKKPEVLAYFAKHQRQIAVFQLPPYSPDFNATERLWHYTRKQSTHNRYFERPAALCQSLFTTFADMQLHPERIQGLRTPFS
jgi:transposase